MYSVAAELALNPSHCACNVRAEQAGAGHDCVAAEIVGLDFALATAAIAIYGIVVVACLIRSEQAISALTKAITIGIHVMGRGALTCIVAGHPLVVQCDVAGSAISNVG